MRRLTLQAMVMVLFLTAWQATVRLGHMSPLVVPAPTDVARALLLHWGDLARETEITALESLEGFLLAAGIAYAVALAFTYARPLEQAVLPYAIALKSTPLIAIAPVIVMWCGNGTASKVVMAAMVSFWPVLIGAVQGLRSVKPEALDLMASLGATKWQVLVKLRVPSSAGHTFAALKIASSLAVVGAVIAELVGSQQGIGHLINENSYYLHTDIVFAGVFCLSVVAISLYAALAYLENASRFMQ